MLHVTYAVEGELVGKEIVVINKGARLYELDQCVKEKCEWSCIWLELEAEASIGDLCERNWRKDENKTAGDRHLEGKIASDANVLRLKLDGKPG